MRPTLLLLLAVGLVNCIPQERFERGFAKRDDTGLSRLALRSSVPAHQSHERTKRAPRGELSNCPDCPELIFLEITGDPRLRRLVARDEGKTVGCIAAIASQLISRYKNSHGRLPSDDELLKFVKENKKIKELSHKVGPRDVELIALRTLRMIGEKPNWTNNPIYTPKEKPNWINNPIYIPKEKPNWINNPIYIPKGSGRRAKRGFFAKLKSKFKQSKKRRNQPNNYEDDDDVDEGNSFEDDFDDFDDFDEAAPLPRRKGKRTGRYRHKREELLERALRSLLVLSSHLNMNMTQNKATPSADVMIKEMDDNQQAKTNSKRSSDQVSENEAQGDDDDDDDDDEEEEEEEDEEAADKENQEVVDEGM